MGDIQFTPLTPPPAPLARDPAWLRAVLEWLNTWLGPLGRWLASFALPSLVSILATYGVLRWSQRRALEGGCDSGVEQPTLSAGGWTALVGLALTATALLIVSAFDIQLGAPTCVMLRPRRRRTT